MGAGQLLMQCMAMASRLRAVEFGQTRHFDVMTIIWLQGLHLAAAALRIGSEIQSFSRHALVCSRYLA
jgi:hypothetical protein